MADLLAKRRRATGQLTQSSGLAVASTAEIKALTDAAWTPALAKEEKHMKDKRGRRAMEFLASGGHLEASQLGGMSRQEIVDILKRAKPAWRSTARSYAIPGKQHSLPKRRATSPTRS